MVIERQISLFKIKDLSDQIFYYLSLTFYDAESQLDSKLNITKRKFETFADRHFKNSIEDLLNEADKIKLYFPEISEQIKETVKELRNKFENIINSENFDLSSIKKLKSNLNKYLDKIIV